MLTGIQLLTGMRGHFHAPCSPVCSCTRCHVILQGCLCRKVTGYIQTFSSPVTSGSLSNILKRGLLNRICVFHLVIERNGYFVYFCFVVQTFCNKNKMKHNELFKE